MAGNDSNFSHTNRLLSSFRLQMTMFTENSPGNQDGEQRGSDCLSILNPRLPAPRGQ